MAYLTRGAKAGFRRMALIGLTGIIAPGGGILGFLRARKRNRASSSGAEPASPEAPEVARILLIRLDLLGDIVFSLPAARALKQIFPASRITMVTLPQTAPLAAASPDVDEVIGIDTNLVRSPSSLLRFATVRHLLSALAQIRRDRFDLAFSLSGRTASLIGLVSRSRSRVGFVDEAYPATLDVAARPGRWSLRRRQHDKDFVRDLVNAANGGPKEGIDWSPRITIDDTSSAAVAQILSEFGVEPEDKLAVLQVGSGYGDFKRWPAASFVELANRLGVAGVRSAIVGSGAEAELADTIAAASTAISLAGRTTITQLLALLKRADIVIGGDSGPLHLAAAIGTPVIGIYGPTDPRVNGPMPWDGQGSVILRRDIACSPCYTVRTRAECPLGDPICMRLVAVHEVFAAVERILRSALTRTG